MFFKGEVFKTLYGNHEDSREMLLIVNYPSGNRFLDLMKDKYFLMVSVLREMAVQEFSFGFTERLDNNMSLQNSRENLDRSKAYAIHHFKTEKSVNNFISIIQKSAESNGVEIIYAGQINSLLFSQNSAGKETQVPCLLDGLILFKSDSDRKLEEYLNSQDYGENIGLFDSSYIGLLNRTM